MNQDILNQVRKLVRSEADEVDWKYHITPVVKYAKMLAEIYQVDEDLVELAALLHDIGRLRFDDKDHHLTGAKEAEKILVQFNLPKETVDEVVHCVKSHRGHSDIPPETIVAKIIANADAMAHFDALLVFMYWRTKQGQSFEDGFGWIEAKIERDWQDKLTLPEAKEMVKEKYRAIVVVLKATKEYM